MNSKEHMRCSSCDKFIQDTPLVIPYTRNLYGALKVKYEYFHKSPMDCAYAEYKREVIRHKSSRLTGVKL